MAIASGNTITISGNGATDRIKLHAGLSKVWFLYGSGATGTLAPTMVRAPDDDGDAEKTAPVKYQRDDINVTASEILDMTGPGYLGFTASGVSGSIVVVVDHVQQN